jgi:NarL family two-component system response regulator LiaR
MSIQPIQVLLVEDHAMVRKGIGALLQEYEGISVIGEAANGLKAIELAERLKPDVVLMDLFMPVMDGIEAIKRILAIQPQQRILVLTGYSGDDKLLPAIKAGALGYLLKDARPEELVQSIQDVYTGEPSLNSTMVWKFLRQASSVETTKRSLAELSEREIEVLRLLSQGKTDQEIAEELFLTEVTIRTHISRIMSKLGFQNRVQAALYGIRSGMVSLCETNNMKEVYNESV